jgi:hypothetical protein
MNDAEIKKAHEIYMNLRKTNNRLSPEDIVSVVRMLGYDISDKTSHTWYHEV